MLLVDTPATNPDLPPMKVEIWPSPNFNYHHGDVMLASSGSDHKDYDRWTKTRWGIWQRGDSPVKRLEAGSFDDAVKAAAELVTAERAAAKSGWIFKKQDRVDALAVLQAGAGWDLVRVDVPVDSFVEPVPGAMAPWQTWTVEPSKGLFRTGDVRRERDGVAAIVGETKVYDLRATKPSGPTEPA